MSFEVSVFNPPVSGGGGGSGTEYTEDDASALDPVGGQLIARRRDTLSTETSADGDNTALNSTAKGELYVKHVDSLTVGNAYETQTGTISALGGASGEVNLAFTFARATVGLLITGTWVGTIAVQVSVDGTTFVASEIIPIASGVIATATTANGSWHIPVGGLKAIKIISTAWTSGTANISLTACTASHVTETYCETADNTKVQVHGAVTTSAPSYSDGTTRSMSLTTAGAVRTDGSAVTQPVSAASLPLPSGAATSANQSTEITSLQLLDDVVVADNAGFTDGTTKLSMAGFILDETAGAALTENDAAAARIDSKRAIVNVIEDATTRGQRLSITAANAAKVDGSAVNQPVKQAQSSFDHGRKSSIGTSAVQITSTSTAAIIGVEVKAARTNSVRVFVGNSDVTADSADSTDGMELGPGESVFIPVDNANKVYVIAESGSSAKVFWAVA